MLPRLSDDSAVSVEISGTVPVSKFMPRERLLSIVSFFSSGMTPHVFDTGLQKSPRLFAAKLRDVSFVSADSGGILPTSLFDPRPRRTSAVNCRNIAAGIEPEIILPAKTRLSRRVRAAIELGIVPCRRLVGRCSFVMCPPSHSTNCDELEQKHGSERSISRLQTPQSDPPMLSNISCHAAHSAAGRAVDDPRHLFGGDHVAAVYATREL